MDICRWRWNRAWSWDSISSMFRSAPCMEERRLAFSLARDSWYGWKTSVFEIDFHFERVVIAGGFTGL